MHGMNFRNLSIFVLAPLCIALVLQSLGDVGSRDSIAYWSAVQAFIRGENPYDLSTLITIQRSVVQHLESPQFFLNPPWAIPLLLPLFRWNFATSALLLLASNISITFFTLRKLSELAAPLAPRYMLLVGAFFPVLSCWYFGQLSCFLMLGAILSFQWIVQNYRPWWRVGVALLLFSIKPQTTYLIAIALMLTMIRRVPRRDVAKVALLALLPTWFLGCYPDLLRSWFSSFAHATQWATSSLPSLAYTATSFVHQPLLLMLPALIIAAVVVAFDRSVITPRRFLAYIIISSLTAPYAWIFDFSPLVIVTYTVTVISMNESTSHLKRWACIVTVATLCIPFEALWTNNLQSYALHPLMVAALFWFAGSSSNDVYIKTEPQRAVL